MAGFRGVTTVVGDEMGLMQEICLGSTKCFFQQGFPNPTIFGFANRLFHNVETRQMTSIDCGRVCHFLSVRRSNPIRVYSLPLSSSTMAVLGPHKIHAEDKNAKKLLLQVKAPKL